MTEITDLARRDEYLDARLKAAARIMWLISRKRGVAYRGKPLEPSESWIADEVVELQRILEVGPIEGPEEYRVLQILGVTQAWISSSARVERANQTSIDVSGRTE